MINDVKYKFYLQIENGVRQQAFPIYPASTNIDLQQESNQRFLRKSVSSKINFVLDDYDFIMTAGMGDEIYLHMEISTDFGLTFVPYYSCKFVLTDCTIDYDNKKISVQPTTADAYTTVLNGAEREFNLIELTPELAYIRMNLRPMLQAYIRGENKLLTMTPSLQWEIDCEATENKSKLKNDYKFAFNTGYIHVNLSGTPSVDCTGTYIANVQDEDYIQRTFTMDSTDALTWYVKHQYLYDSNIHDYYHHVTVHKANDDTLMYEYKTSNNSDYPLYSEFTFDNVSPYVGTLKGQFFSKDLYTRLVCDVDDINGNATYDRPADDITDYDLKYDRLYPVGGGLGAISDKFSNDPTPWGRRENQSVYYEAPIALPNLVPIATNLWNEVSLWVLNASFSYESEPDNAISTLWFGDAYTIDSCISVLLGKIAPSITHEATTAYSEFLYGSVNPITNETFRVFLTQKTNILKGKYTIPAQKALTTLTKILNILKNAFGLYWFIDGTKLRIEHISWFMKGGSYTNDVWQTGYDLTTIQNIRNGKTWDFGQSVVTFDKAQMSRYYKFEWNEEATAPFDGSQIEVVNKSTEDKTETLKVDASSDVDYMFMYPSHFSQDGFALLIGVPCDALIEHGTSTGTKGNNDDYTTPLYRVDGMALQSDGTLTMTATGGGTAELATFDADGNYIGALSLETISSASTSVSTFFLSEQTAQEVEFIGFRMISGTLTFNLISLTGSSSWMMSYKSLTYTDEYGRTQTRNCQNGIGAMAYLQPNFLTYQMPASNLKINGVPQTAKGLSKKKKQEVRFPIDAVTIDTNKLVKTSVGLGEIEKISLNLSSRTIKATLAHDTSI